MGAGQSLPEEMRQHFNKEVYAQAYCESREIEYEAVSCHRECSLYHKRFLGNIPDKNCTAVSKILYTIRSGRANPIAQSMYQNSIVDDVYIILFLLLRCRVAQKL